LLFIDGPPDSLIVFFFFLKKKKIFLTFDKTMILTHMFYQRISCLLEDELDNVQGQTCNTSNINYA